MSIAIRSQLIAGVALLGAGAIAAMTPSAAGQLPLRTIAVQNTAMEMAETPVSPFRAFAPVAGAAFRDTYAIVQERVSAPFPILRDVLTNQVEYLFGTPAQLRALIWYNPQIGLIPAVGQAAFMVGDASFKLPDAIAEAANLALNNDVAGAIRALQNATLAPLTKASDLVTRSVQRILVRQLQVAQNLVTAIPEANRLVFGATVNAINQILKTAIAAGQQVGKAAATGNPVSVWNAAIGGAAEVAQLAEEVTIGNGVPDEAYELAEARVIAPAPPQSIRQAATQAQFRIREAIRPERYIYVKDVAQAAAAVEAGGATRAAASEKAAPAATSKRTGVGVSGRSAR